MTTDPTLLGSFTALYRALRRASLASTAGGRGRQEPGGQALQPLPDGPEAVPTRSTAEVAPFRDRADAGQRLAHALEAYRGADLSLVSMSDGGAVVAAKISEELHAGLDRLLMREVRSPFQPQLAIGLIVDGPALNIFRNDTMLTCLGFSERQFWDACQIEITELRREREHNLGDRQPLGGKGRILVLVDDGLATGHMMRAALRILRSRDAKRIVVAIPVASKPILDTIRGEADEIVHVGLHNGPHPTSHYAELTPVTGQELVRALSTAT
jgi:putative phosphoribosyl transferase